MLKKKILKIFGLILLVIMMVFLIHTIRNYIIITNLQNKISNYANSTNYYTKSVSRENNETVVTMEYYKKDNKEVVFLERNQNGEIYKISFYNNGERTNTFWDNKEGKTAQLNTDSIMRINIHNGTETDNKLQTLLESITANIKTTKCDGKDCYSAKGLFSTVSLSEEGATTYIYKDTGLMFKTIEGDRINERTYEFNNVNDSIFIEPDLSQYKIQK